LNDKLGGTELKFSTAKIPPHLEVEIIAPLQVFGRMGKGKAEALNQFDVHLSAEPRFSIDLNLHSAGDVYRIEVERQLGGHIEVSQIDKGRAVNE
jgi:hypothetical protein